METSKKSTKKIFFKNFKIFFFKNIFFQKIHRVRQPGIEPGSIAWKATMLTFTPPTLRSNMRI